ncbi:hypothetical protein HYX11_00805 [Candidatus Woesearchaeota archaeon]|nr:hypothetical protein [Candidatus Woesearchaeota archaeon]
MVKKKKIVNKKEVPRDHIVFEGRKVWYFLAAVIIILLGLFLLFYFNLRSEAVVGEAVRGMDNVCIFKCV